MLRWLKVQNLIVGMTLCLGFSGCVLGVNDLILPRQVSIPTLTPTPMIIPTNPPVILIPPLQTEKSVTGVTPLLIPSAIVAGLHPPFEASATAWIPLATETPFTPPTPQPTATRQVPDDNPPSPPGHVDVPTATPFPLGVPGG